MATPARMGMAADPDATVSKADELFQQIDKQCTDLTPECAKSMKGLVGAIKDGASNKNAEKIQQSAVDFGQKLQANGGCVQALTACAEKLKQTVAPA
ncbi:hypothetical protein HRG_009968 [Hirsutella rhossiliensis]|uniref:Uncharacterized protein n=1 Tax=Hirsutella rhossiliensis TaxID=111463 RepID=A0A9P8SDN1_9HYPO|nr:uncharacterized protein HRG_09968 [Hirsutella rhossiliensis]KAH0958923.1 hypothetical protein HRG_09968 [Hirsutella rhossiliensis]